MNGVHEHICTLFMLGEGEREKSSWHSFPWCWRPSWRSLKGRTVLHAVTLPTGIFVLLEGAPIALGGTSEAPFGGTYLRDICVPLQLSAAVHFFAGLVSFHFPTLSKMLFNQLLFLKHWLQLGCWVGLAEWAKENLLCSFFISRCPIGTLNPGDFLMFSQNCQLGNWVYFWRTLWDWGVEML